MTDFHAHILPKMDDGSKSVDESLEMLEMLRTQGVTRVVASPHYYRRKETVAEFLFRRARSMSELADAIGGAETPRIIAGAEVEFFAGLSREPDIDKLCVGGGPLLIVEMPFGIWTSPVVNEIYQLIASRGIAPIVAHVERYAGGRQNQDALNALIDFGAVIQSNAEFFLSPVTRRRAIRMFRDGQIHITGSDCHNTSSRAPNMGGLDAFLRKKLKRDEYDRLRAFENDLSRQAEPAGAL